MSDLQILRSGASLSAELIAAGVGAGDLLGVVVGSGGECVLGRPGAGWQVAADVAAAMLADVEKEVRPRWVWWSPQTARLFVAAGVRPARCWDLAAVHRLLVGGAVDDPARVWAAARGLPTAAIPVPVRNRADDQVDLFTAVEGERLGEEPLTVDGYADPGWVAGGWAFSASRAVRWAQLAVTAAEAQQARLATEPPAGDPVRTAWAESAAEVVCAELEADGLPFDVSVGEQLVASMVGPRTSDDAAANEQRRARDQQVFDLVPPAGTVAGVDLRNPAVVRDLLARVGIVVPDTRSWRLQRFVDVHPLVPALLAWRKAERIGTTYGYRWLDTNVAGGRLRGAWRASDGAAGRMTASAGLHNLPGELRPAVRADPGFVFVRADLGQIEPRVLAVVSGDTELARASAEPDLYAPVAARLGVARGDAKIAVLAAMYGQTSGSAGQALDGLRRAYPTAMTFLDDAYTQGYAGRPVRTYGGRRIPMSTPAATVAVADPDGADSDESDADTSDRIAARAAARGRYARNALIQGAAAELFKAWTVTVRAALINLTPSDDRCPKLVLCLHDELLIHTPVDLAPAVTDIVSNTLNDAARRWAPNRAVHFIADIRTVTRWSDAKD